MSRLLLLLFCCLFGCQQQESSLFSGTAMTIDYRIIVGAALQPTERLQVSKEIQAVFEEVDAVYNKFNPQSELSLLNSLKAGERVPLSQKLERLLQISDSFVSLTKGKFDPSIEPLQKLWKKHLEKGLEPSEQEILAIRPALGWQKIHFGNGYFFKEHSLTQLDLGGIANGYCVDLLVERLNGLGYRNVFVEWGGEIRATGEHPDKRPWRVFISRLGNQNPSEALATVELSDQAIATSGDYMQFWKIDDSEQIYTHLFDLKTCRPVQVTNQSIASSSVLAPTCTFADAIAKVGLLFATLEEAEAWAQEIRLQYPEVRFWFIARDTLL